MSIDRDLLRFRCSSCGRCCREPLLPITDRDLRRLVRHTGQVAASLVRWVSDRQIELDHEPEAFVLLRHGKRVMTLRQGRGGCVFLEPNHRCAVYHERPLGCRVFPFDSEFDRSGQLRRLELIQATECAHELDGRQRSSEIRRQQRAFRDEIDEYHAKVAAFNGLQASLRRRGRPMGSARAFLDFLGV